MRPRLTKFGWIVRGLSAVVLGMVLAGSGWLIVMDFHGQRLLSVQSGSMEPTFWPGDALVVEPVSAGQLRVGQVISYRSPFNAQLVISHRLVKIDRRTGWLTTQGDALARPDQSFPPRLMIGRAAAVAPGLGRLLDFFHRPLGLILGIYLPCTGLIMLELWRLAAHSNRPYNVRLYV